jgi:CobQ-like glutamine amidotransferase family enzyme
MSALRILHLYADELGINGDRGNVLALAQRLAWRGRQAEVVTVGAGHSMPHDVDLVHIGSGPKSARDALLSDLGDRAETLQAWAAAGVPMIGVGAGFHLMSRVIISLDGRQHAGAGLVPVTVRDVTTRTVGEALGMPTHGRRTAGYLNHAVEVVREGGEPLVILDRAPVGPSVAREEIEGGGQLEGIRYEGRIGTHLHGPVLPMNPDLADELLTLALARHGDSLPAPDERTREADELARRSRAAIAHRLGRSGTEV